MSDVGSIASRGAHRLEWAGTEVRRLQISDGDVVVIRGDGRREAVARALEEALYQMGMGRCLIIDLPMGVDLASIDEAQMEAVGWIRKREGDLGRASARPSPNRPSTEE